MNIGAMIAHLRKKKKLTQKELGALLNLSSGTVSNYENGVHCPDLEMLVQMADVFEVTTDFMLGRTDYQCTPEVLSEYLIKDRTVRDIANTILTLDQKSQDAVLQYIDFLSKQGQSE